LAKAFLSHGTFKETQKYVILIAFVLCAFLLKTIWPKGSLDDTTMFPPFGQQASFQAEPNVCRKNGFIPKVVAPFAGTCTAPCVWVENNFTHRHLTNSAMNRHLFNTSLSSSAECMAAKWFSAKRHRAKSY
jgi:hypothetical protein